MSGAMYRHVKYSEAEIKLAGVARQKAMNRDVLYHGTRYAQSILKTGILFRAEFDGQVCLTRSPEVAAYWAMMVRDDDEGRGSIFIFDRQSLGCQYKLESQPKVFWLNNTLFHDEAEEEIWDNVVDIGNHLIGFVCGPTVPRSHKHKTLNRKHRTQIAARLLRVKRRVRRPNVQAMVEKKVVVIRYGSTFHDGNGRDGQHVCSRNFHPEHRLAIRIHTCPL